MSTIALPPAASVSAQIPPNDPPSALSHAPKQHRVGVAVLNSQNDLLVGQTSVAQEWHCPQGVVDDPHPSVQLVRQAACRILKQETGLVEGQHVMAVDQTVPPTAEDNPTNQQRTLDTVVPPPPPPPYWVIFRLVDARANSDPQCIVESLPPTNERKSAKFTKLAWCSIEKLLQDNNRQPYVTLQTFLETHVVPLWQTQIEMLDWTGKWKRVSDTALVQALVERGWTAPDAQQEVAKPYVQSWQRGESPANWIVTTYCTDGVTPRRELEYSVGDWPEYYEGETVLFGRQVVSDGKILRRQTQYVAMPDASPLPLAHVTLTQSPLGLEESRRYQNGNDRFILRRTLWKRGEETKPVVSEEVFVRVSEDM